MYGGVSLAVYINGVATEFFLAVQGSSVYGLLKCLRNAEIAVDIISGASAGGINGILLGCALSGEGRNLGKTAALWRDKGGISDLLHRPGTLAPASLFDGEKYYLGQLRDCFVELTKKGEPDVKAVPSPTDALDLFVTGTDYYGKTWLWRDALDSSIQVKDHRGVFRLRYRKGRQHGNDFESPTALAKLARITSSFPAALAPVPVIAGRQAEQPDALLTQWGQLTERTTRHFIDGGVLDNKPFSDTIEQIYYRTAHLPVDRKLFFVEPDPEATVVEGKDSPAPDILGVITGSLITLPRYESIAGDLRDIARFNRNLDHRRDFIEELRTPSGFYQPAIAAQKKIYQSWRWRWLQEVADAARAETAAVHGDVTAPPLPSFDTLTPSVDVEFSLRRLFHVTYWLYDRMYEGKKCLAAKNQPFDVPRNVLALLNRHIQLLKLVRWAVDRAVAEWADPSDPCRERRELDQLLLHLLQRVDISPQEPGEGYLSDCTLADIKTILGQRLAATTLTSSSLTILDQEASLSRDVLAADHEVVAEARREYDAYETLDAHIYPFELAAGIRERDKIETIRISAQDAQLGFSGRPANEKVSGDALSHFGGFFKRTWRSNDIMWGRLDGRCQLIRGLLRQDEFEKRLERPQEVAALRANLDAFARLHNTTRDKLVASLFPDGAETDQKALQSWLDRLTAGTQGAASELDGLLATIVQLSQAEIVKGGVTSVEQDAKEEATTWGEPEFEFPTGLDAAALARSPTDFRAVYRVGEEKLSRDIPPRVLLRIFAQGALVLRDAVFGAADSRVQKHGRFLARPLQFTRKVLGWPLQLAYWYATVTRRRSYRLGAAVVAATLFAAFLLVGPPVLGSTTADGFQFHWPSVIAFIGLPTLVLTGEVALARARREQPVSPLWRQRLLAVLWFLVIESAIGLLVWGVVRNRYAGLVSWLTSFDGWELTILLGSPVLLTAVVLYTLFRRSP